VDHKWTSFTECNLNFILDILKDNIIKLLLKSNLRRFLEFLKFKQSHLHIKNKSLRE